MPHVLAQDLKNAVLQAAMQGKLTEHLESDESPKYSSSYDNEGEDRFDIPENWRWYNLQDLLSIKTGKKDQNYATKDGRYNFYTCAKEVFKAPSYSFDGEALILPGNGANVGEVTLFNGKFEAYQRTYVLQALDREINMKYVYYTLLENWNHYNKNKMFGSAIPYIKLGNLQKYPIPLPPIEEQARIVAKVDELMAKIDEYEKIEKELVSLHKAFPGNMKDAILQAAMQGKLTEQLESDTDAFALLKEMSIHNSNKKVINQSDIEIPYEDLPENWAYTCLKNICDIQTGKKDANFGTPNGKYNFFTCAKEPIKCNSYSYDMNAILMAGNGDISNISRFNGKFEAYQRTYIVKVNDLINDKFLYYAILDRWVRYNVDKLFGSTIPYVRLGNLERYSIPLPPIEEQQRIVEKLDQLLPLCEGLETLV